MTFPEPGLRMLKKFAAGRTTMAGNFPGHCLDIYASRIATISCVRGLMTTI